MRTAVQYCSWPSTLYSTVRYCTVTIQYRTSLYSKSQKPVNHNMFRHLGTVCQTERHPGAFCYYSTVVLQYSTALYCLKKQGPVFNIENELTKYLPCYTVQYSIHCDEHGLATCLVHSTVRYYNTVPVQYSIYSQIGSYSPLKVLICSQILQLYWQELRILIQYLLYQYSSLLYSTVHFSLMVPFNESLVSKITHRLHSRAMISILI
jgi:hypothetical protein